LGLYFNFLALIVIKDTEFCFLIFQYRFFFVFETESHFAAQAGLELKILLPGFMSARIIGMHHHTQLDFSNVIVDSQVIY
jgi:hypothetical protein